MGLIFFIMFGRTVLVRYLLCFGARALIWLLVVYQLIIYLLVIFSLWCIC